MRVIGLLSWYAESPTWLAATIASMARFCDHVVAVDGAFALFPDAAASSGAEQHEAIVKTAEAAGMGVTLHVPNDVWRGNEIEKTTFRFHLAEAIAEPERDWYFILDADSVVVDHTPTVREDLENTNLDVASVRLSEWIDWHATPQLEQLGRAAYLAGRSTSDLRCFFRAIPGLWCEGTHAHFFAERDGVKLNLRGSVDQTLEPSLALDVIVEHRNRMRVQERAYRAKEFYQRRDRLGIEPGFPTGPPKLEEPVKEGQIA